VREGRVTASEVDGSWCRGPERARVLHEAILQRYLRAEAASALWLPIAPREEATLAEALAARGRPIASSRASAARRAIEAAAENARLALEDALARKGGKRVRYQPGATNCSARSTSTGRRSGSVPTLEHRGREPVASVTVSENGQPKVATTAACACTRPAPTTSR
jgi:excinuclease UvrABC nuclease subunit